MRVKVTAFWNNDIEIFNLMKYYGFGNNIWKNVEFTPNDNYDKLIILTRPYDLNKEYNSKNAITFRTEPLCSKHHISHETSYTSPINIPLWTYTDKHTKIVTQKKKIQKSELLSSVTSELSYLDGHQKRLTFIYYLDQKIESGFRLWGKPYHGIFFNTVSSYSGQLIDKFDGLLDYQYHLNCENSFEKNYFTEKIIDPILSESLCFYDGCPNIANYIDERAFVKINVADIEESIQKLIDNIQNNQWQKRLKYIRNEKKRALTTLNPLNMIWMAVNEKDIIKECRVN